MILLAKDQKHSPDNQRCTVYLTGILSNTSLCSIDVVLSGRRGCAPVLCMLVYMAGMPWPPFRSAWGTPVGFVWTAPKQQHAAWWRRQADGRLTCFHARADTAARPRRMQCYRSEIHSQVPIPSWPWLSLQITNQSSSIQGFFFFLREARIIQVTHRKNEA